MISAPSSGSGKTTITAALATYHRLQGKDVRVFKTGPDFIDPMILEQASGNPVYQLDLWMVGEQHCQELLFEAAQQANLILIEGVMGLFDGTPSTADLSVFFNIPILAIIDGSAMAQSFGAVAYGLAKYREDVIIQGVVANKIASDRHADMVLSSVPKSIPYMAAFTRNPEIALAERHLGLVQAGELIDIEEKLTIAAKQIAQSQFAKLPPTVAFKQATVRAFQENNNPLANQSIIVAKDLAFNFLYRANLRLLQQAGAKLVYTSPLNDKALPVGDALYIPGGYPELYAKQLSDNKTYIDSVQSFANSGKPILAECGGMLYLLKELRTKENEHYSMTGIIEGKGEMKTKLSAIGQQYAELSTFINIECGVDNSEIRGHSFHYSQAQINLPVMTRTRYYPHEREGEAIYLQNNILASYMHWYFPSNPQFIFDFFNQELNVK